MSSKKQQTFAKLSRERRVIEKRERKAEKKAAAAAEKLRIAEGGDPLEDATAFDESVDGFEQDPEPAA